MWQTGDVIEAQEAAIIAATLDQTQNAAPMAMASSSCGERRFDSCLLRSGG